MIDKIPAAAMFATLSKRGGRNVARQFAHLQYVRARRLESFARKAEIEIIEFDPKESPSKKDLRRAFKQSGTLMAEYIAYGIEHDGAVSNFKRGVVPMVGYFISHEAHHRGNILLTIKQSGIKLPDKLKWGIWEWNKI